MAHLTFTPQQRGHLGTGPRGGFRQKTHTHIPGSVVRGAYAAAWLARHGGEVAPGDRSEFVELFEGPTIFGPLHFARTPTPRSIMHHKYRATDHCGQRFWDRAVTVEVPPYCPDCDSPIEPAGPSDDPYAVESPGQLRGGSTRTVNRTHVAIGKDGTGIDGSLYVREDINPHVLSSFSGHLHGSAHVLRLLEAITHVRVGGSRSTGGRMTATIDDAPWRPAVSADPRRVVIRLISPGIFVDERGAPLPAPSDADIERTLGVPGTVRARWTRWTEVGGWHAASGLPKHVEQAVDVGSTYVITTERPIQQTNLDALSHGIGLRRHEGFGAVGDWRSDPAEWTANE